MARIVNRTHAMLAANELTHKLLNDIKRQARVPQTCESILTKLPITLTEAVFSQPALAQGDSLKQTEVLALEVLTGFGMQLTPKMRTHLCLLLITLKRCFSCTRNE